MDWGAAAGLGLAACAVGAQAARLAGPVACTWPSLTSASLVLRIQRLSARLPGRGRRLAGGAVLMVVAVGACALAYAANPAAPRRVADLARVAEAGLRSALWVAPELASAPAVSPAKPGQLPEAGLSGEEATAAASASAASITAGGIGIPGEATIERYLELGYARFGPNFISPETAADPDGRRRAAYMAMIVEETNRRTAEIAAGTRTGSPGLDAAAQRAFLGEAGYIDMTALNADLASRRDAEEAASLAARPITGPSTFYLPAGANSDASMISAGVDPRGVWISSMPDAQGGRLMTRSFQTQAEMRAVGLPGLTRAAPAP